ncbi:phosphoglucomutase, alpha-D-glucose phosphate-specific [Prosthecochloris aestuarii DSM 271]|uniref:Phosphoglucomutase, alpha-D-glucose phosphate-specific n=1 Tax=Prosthecochloris aestuarii (strain DSM 271 / SK 413) TaxID=290512 RepID=B4S7A8_PROA2|nr:phosphoglucomutase (alpha-D-glucose-1,6-bisphosphate-dependent) [Prosthecochloris aestuarii]ACF45945.1 phosphoglucomutase, alpha-D-glucose phosphate-specific [Prosthecochloris aestuarii DSM 271]
MSVSPHAGKLPDDCMLVNVAHLVTAYFAMKPDPSVSNQRVSFGTSGHRGSSFSCSFNEAHVLAIAQAICDYRSMKGIDGPLFLGMDTHALSEPAMTSALEVLAANGVDVMISADEPWTPTPVVSHAILGWNRSRSRGLSDGILITPSHNPPEDGGFKYNPPHGGPAGADETSWIEKRANLILETKLADVRRVSYASALGAATTHRYDYMEPYIGSLGEIIDLEAVSRSGLRLGVDPLGGAGVHYWKAIQERYSIDLTVLNETVDPTFRFMSVDRDGKIRMDPSSSWAMQPLVNRKDEFDIAFACDTDYDRHGIVTRGRGLMQPNHFLSAAVSYLFEHRELWGGGVGIGKTVVTSSMINRVAEKLGRDVYEVPVGFKWFVDGLLAGTLGFAGEESAGASFLRRDGSVWSTDKDGFIAALLSAEMTAITGRDPSELYRDLTNDLGEPHYARIDAPASAEEKVRLKQLSASDIGQKELAGETILHMMTDAPGNGQPIGGLKIETRNGWFAARPSGTEDVYKIYAESFLGPQHLARLQEEARDIVAAALCR